MRKVTVALLVATLLLMLCQWPMTAVAADNSGFELQASQTAIAGGYAEITVSYIGEKEKVGGLQFYLEYDTAVLSYVAGSRTVLVPGIVNADLGADSSVGNRVHFVWESAKDQGLTVKGDIATYRFRVNPQLSSSVNETQVKLVVRAFYKDDYPAMSDYIYTDVIRNCKIAVSVNAALNETVAKIDAIGEVTLSDETKTKIDAARAAYNALSPDLRELVSNSSALFAAEKKYAQLLEESGDGLLQAKVDAFRKTHEGILGKKLDDLTLNDKGAVEAALTAWEALDLETRAATITDKRQLNKFALKMEALESDAAAWKDAEDVAALLRTKYAGVLKMDPNVSDDILQANQSSITSFLKEIEENAVYVKYLKTVMADDIDLLNAFQDRLSKIETPKEENADAVAFRQEFGWLLNYTVEDVLKSDLPDLQTALYAYGLLSEDAKAELPGVEPLLTALYEKAKSLPDEVIKEIITETQKEIVYVDKEGNSIQLAPPQMEINIPADGINPLVWYMMGCAIFTVMLFGVEFCIYSAIRRKKKQQEVVGA